MKNHMTEFVRKSVPKAICWNIGIHKEKDRHPINALTHSVEKIGPEVAGNYDATIAFQQFVIFGMGPVGSIHISLTSRAASSAESCPFPFASIFVSIYFRDKGISFPIKRDEQLA